jgi:hypothetical protein
VTHLDETVSIYARELREKGFICPADVIEALCHSIKLDTLRIGELEGQVQNLEEQLKDARAIG